MARSNTFHPIIKWAGGKTQLLPDIEARLPTRIGAYCEPFLGGAAVFFHLWHSGRLKDAELILLGDLNEELIRMYRTVAGRVDHVVATLDTMEISEEYYYWLRDRNPAEIDEVENACRFIYLNKMGYNGLYRVNKKGKFNVPWGKPPKTRKLYDPDKMYRASEALQAATLVVDCFDFTMLKFKAAVPTDGFVYLDPPYVPVDPKGNFTGFTKEGFSEDAQLDLSLYISELGEEGIRVLTSNSDCPFVDNMYAGLDIRKIYARRNVNSDGNGRGEVLETLSANYNDSGAIFYWAPGEHSEGETDDRIEVSA